MMDKTIDPNRYVEPSDTMLSDLYEMYFPPRDEEMYKDLQDMIDFSEWTDPM